MPHGAGAAVATREGTLTSEDDPPAVDNGIDQFGRDRRSVAGACELRKRYGPELRLLIVGGGIVGLTLASALEQRGMLADVVERGQSYGGLGYVIGLWPSGLNVLCSLGLRESLLKIGLPAGQYYAYDVYGRPLLLADFGAFASEYGDMFYVARADLVAALSPATTRQLR